MTAVFFCGPLAHARLRKEILGPHDPLVDAVLPDWGLYRGYAPGSITLAPQPGQRVKGKLWVQTDREKTTEARARLVFYARSIGLSSRRMMVDTEQGRVVATVFHDPGEPDRGTPWDAANWQAEQAPSTVILAKEVMAGYGQTSAAKQRARLGPIMVRAASRLRAQTDTAPATVRRSGAEVVVRARRQPYVHFFSVEEYDLSFDRFDGTASPTVNRAAFVSGDAVTVLPYDPVRDRVLLVEQFRTGPFARGDGNPWQLEAIAGRIDPGESPEACARREAVEEAGLTLGALLPVAQYYPSPGAKTEYIWSYVALTDLPDTAAGVFGIASEAEDIRGHLLPFEQTMALVASGEVQNGPLLLCLLWLQRERSGLRA